MKPNSQPTHAVVLGPITRRARLIACAVGLSCWTSPLLAEEDSRSADTAAARDLAIEGLKLADSGNCGEAIDKLSRAEKLHHAPIVLGRLGECEIAAGRIVDGTENLRRLLRESVPSDPPAALVKARERAQVALDAAKPKIALIVISVKEPTEGVSVTVDGQPVQSAMFDRGRPMDPGDHVVEAIAPGYLKLTRPLTLAPGEKQEIALKLAIDPQASVKPPEPNAREAAPAAARQPPAAKQQRPERINDSATDDTSSRAPNYAPSYVLWSVGAAAAAVGGVFGYLALKDKHDLDKQCSNSLCDPSAQGQLDTAKRDALLSTVLMASGGAVVAIGTVVYLLTGPNNEKEPTTASRTATPVVGLGQVGLQGTF